MQVSLQHSAVHEHNPSLERAERALSVFGKGRELQAGVCRRQEHPSLPRPVCSRARPRAAMRETALRLIPCYSGERERCLLQGREPACHTNQASHVHLSRAKPCHNNTALLTQKRGRNMAGSDRGLLTYSWETLGYYWVTSHHPASFIKQSICSSSQVHCFG